MHRRRSYFAIVLVALMVANASSLDAQPISDAILGKFFRYNQASTRFTWGDTWVTAWAADGALYSTVDDTKGFENALRPSGGRNLTLATFDQTGLDDFIGRTVNSMDVFGREGQSVLEMGVDGLDHYFSWKANGLASIDGILYMTVSRHSYGAGYDDLRQRAKDANIIKSTDNGLTWTPLPPGVGEPYALQDVMFTWDQFATPVFVEYGQDGSAPDPAPDESDVYIYAVSNNGFWNNGDSLYLGRVRREHIGNLDSAEWEFVTEVVDEVPAWGPLAKAQPILSNPGRLSIAGVTYIPVFQKYVMPQWYYVDMLTPGACGEIPPPWPGPPHPAVNFFNPYTTCVKHTVWEFYQADHPWGPWELFFVHDFTDRNPDSVGTGFYNPVITNKFIDEKPFVIDDKEYLTMWILTAGNYMTYAQAPEENPFAYFEWSTTRYTLHMIPLTLVRDLPK